MWIGCGLSPNTPRIYYPRKMISRPTPTYWICTIRLNGLMLKPPTRSTGPGREGRIWIMQPPRRRWWGCLFFCVLNWSSRCAKSVKSGTLCGQLGWEAGFPWNGKSWMGIDGGLFHFHKFVGRDTHLHKKQNEISGTIIKYLGPF